MCPVFIDPQSRLRVLHSKHIGDISYAQPNWAEPAVRDESISVVGGWKDYTGSGGPNSKAQQQWGGAQNELWGTDAHIESKEDLPNLNVVGQNKGTTRRRLRLVYKKLD